MGNAPNKPMDIKEVISFTESPPKLEVSLSDDEMRKRLTSQGILFPDECSHDELCTAIAITDLNGFWRLNPHVHPNFGRVKNWLMVHNKYRDYLRQLADQQDINLAKAAFTKWHSKLEGHSQFEDEQLFKFFHEHVKSIEEDLLELEKQHKTQLGQTQKSIFQGESEDAWKIALQIYVSEMLKHLEQEEIVLVKPWLHLTDEEYKTYRTYLSWKYAAMY